MHDIIVFENLRFRPFTRHVDKKQAFSKISTMDVCGRQAKPEKKISVFKQKWIGVEGT